MIVCDIIVVLFRRYIREINVLFCYEYLCISKMQIAKKVFSTYANVCNLLNIMMLHYKREKPHMILETVKTT